MDGGEIEKAVLASAPHEAIQEGGRCAYGSGTREGTSSSVSGNTTSIPISAGSICTPQPVYEVSVLGTYFLHQELIYYSLKKRNFNVENAVAVLESCGYRVGGRLWERLALKASRFPEQRDCVKFICKDVWHALFQKQADRLQTNRRGGYVIQDSNLPWLRKLPGAAATAAAALQKTEGSEIESLLLAEAEAAARAETAITAVNCSQPGDELINEAVAAVSRSHTILHVAFVCGVIKGSLAAMGLCSSVVAESIKPPSCSFQIRIL